MNSRDMYPSPPTLHTQVSARRLSTSDTPFLFTLYPRFIHYTLLHPRSLRHTTPSSRLQEDTENTRNEHQAQATNS